MRRASSSSTRKGPAATLPEFPIIAHRPSSLDGDQHLAPPFSRTAMRATTRSGSGAGVEVGVGVAEGVSVGSAVGVGVGVGVAEGLSFGSGVAVDVGVGVADGVSLGSGVGVAEGVSVAVVSAVGLGVGEGVSVGVGLGDAVACVVAVGVADGVGLLGWLAVGVEDGVTAVADAPAGPRPATGGASPWPASSSVVGEQAARTRVAAMVSMAAQRGTCIALAWPRGSRPGCDY